MSSPTSPSERDIKPGDYTPTREELFGWLGQIATESDVQRVHRFLAARDVEQQRIGAVKALREFAASLQKSAEWTESNFIAGPNSTPYIEHAREFAGRAIEDAEYIEREGLTDEAR